jgi:ubiquinone/menaquinone biosynthesis C-methylase UbiE
MGGSLPEMANWDPIFDETYLETYLPFTDEERTRAEALGAAALAQVEPGAKVLDCPCGFARHSLVLAETGYRVTGLDRSETQLAEARRRKGNAEWPRLVRGDYRELPFADASFDAVLNLFSSLGYLERDEDVGVLREFRRVLRPGGALVVETAHRDGVARLLTAQSRRTWMPLPDGSLFLEERELDWLAGTMSERRQIVRPDGERLERSFVLHVRSMKEWAEMLREAGFESVEAFGAWDGETRATPETWRLILRAR